MSDTWTAEDDAALDGLLKAAAPGPNLVTDVVCDQVGEPEPGHWCARCLLPSAWLVRFRLRVVEDRGRGSERYRLYCADCDNWWAI